MREQHPPAQGMRVVRDDFLALSSSWLIPSRKLPHTHCTQRYTGLISVDTRPGRLSLIVLSMLYWTWRVLWRTDTFSWLPSVHPDEACLTATTRRTAAVTAR